VPRAQYETLASLGLLKIGRCGLFDGDRPEAWGQIANVQHLVATRPLTRQPAKTRYRISGGILMRAPGEHVRYEVDGREARHYEFDGDSFMSVEPYDGSVAINWSTALPIATVLERLDSKLLGRVRNCTVFDMSHRTHLEVEPAETLADLRAGRCSYPFVRMESEELTLVWQQPAYPKHVDEDVSSGRIGIIYSELDAKGLAQMMRATATPPVGACVKELVEGVEALSSKPR
jgi:ribosomal protein L30/L7E